MSRKLIEITTTELCSLGCNKTANFKSIKNKFYCESAPSKCEVIRKKNSAGTKQAHKDGKIPGWSDLLATGKFQSNKNKFNYEVYRNKDESDIFCYDGKGSHKAILIVQRGHECESCHNREWLNKQITLELEHIDGDRRNNTKENLKLLCPNCHSLTPTWRKRKTTHNSFKYSIDVYITAIQKSKNVHQVCRELDLAATPSTYASIYKIMVDNNLKF